MKNISRLFRLIRINFILVRYNLDEIIFATRWFYPIRFLSYFNPWHWFLKNKLTRGERLRKALENLGPIFIKAGQILSTRHDLLPDDVAEELAKLQDQVPSFSGTQAKRIIEHALNAKIHDVFGEFHSKALASASVAQVHAATLLDGTSVVVKVLRPNIKKRIDQDLDLLFILARLAEKYWSEAQRFKPRQIVEEIEQTLHDELDLLREGANASQLRRNFKNSPLLYIPEIYWDHCRQNVLVMERIEGIQIHNISALKAAGINMKKLAERGIEIFFTQVFRDSFFHADMHPGNVFVARGDPENPEYIAVDFGIVGSLSTKDQRYLAENMLAFFKRDYQRVAELHVASGWLPPDTRVDQFEGAIRAVCEPIFEKPLKDISFGQLLLRLFQAARRFNINIQPQLILLQKTLLNIEGVGRQIYPELDLWTTAAPFLERWLKKQIGVKAFLRRVRENIPYWSEKFPEIPGLIHDVLTQTRENQEAQRFERERIRSLENTVQKRSPSRYFILGLGCALAASSGILFSLSQDHSVVFSFLGAGILSILVGVFL
jgi:ubiquinone biosynthesis protein